jgi:hypothetical protein
LDGSFSNGYFTSGYASILADLQNIKANVMAHPGLDNGVDKNKLSIASILSVYTFQVLTDMFGPIPYQQALLGDKNRTPSYDAQKDIYTGLIDELRQSLDQMDESKESFGAADVIYQGNVALWKKFGYSLLMRLAMRISDVESNLAKTTFAAAQDHALSGVTDNANFRWLVSPPNNNGLHQQRVERGDADLGLSNILIDKTLKPLNDPRLLVWADERENGGGYFGRPFGQNDGNAASEPTTLYSQPSGAAIAKVNGSSFRPYDILRPDAFYCHMNYAEVCFMMAEAAERGWNVQGTAAEWYDKGISASLQEWGITDQNMINQYLAQPAVAYTTAAGDWKQKIGVQKWLALFNQPLQAWIEWRRLDFVKLELPVDGALGDIGNSVAPVRLIYPVDEQSLNSTHYAEGVQLLGGPDKMSTRVWWDVH